MNGDEIRREIGLAFEYSYDHEDWVNPLSEALAGVSAETAIWRPSPDGKGIWDIVNHLAVWNEDIVLRVATGNPQSPADGHWPSPPSHATEAEWEKSKKRLWDSIESVNKMIETTPIEKIQASHYHLADLLCRFTHMGYHLGQITKMRECVDLPSQKK